MEQTVKQTIEELFAELKKEKQAKKSVILSKISVLQALMEEDKEVEKDAFDAIPFEVKQTMIILLCKIISDVTQAK
jgi:hypothetical protein